MSNFLQVCVYKLTFASSCCPLEQIYESHGSFHGLNAFLLQNQQFQSRHRAPYLVNAIGTIVHDCGILKSLWDRVDFSHDAPADCGSIDIMFI